MQGHFIFLICLIVRLNSVLCSEDEPDKRDEKLISTFQIVRFPNEPCVGSSTRNGTCYTSAECSDKGGTSSGSCADGFGVCCTFLISTCGSSSSENTTYWKNPTTVSSGVCDLTICPVGDDICSIRLDFTTFVITGPSTRTTLEVTRRFGQPAGIVIAAANVEDIGSSHASNCRYDTFQAQGASGSSNPPVICGTNTGQHAYVEMDNDRCNRLTFNFADKAGSTITYTNNRGRLSLSTSRAWDITATQIECTSLTLPPTGCTQYFWGNGAYILTSANYLTAATDWHLANQHDRFCMRRERGNCIGCFVALAAANFMLSGGEGYTHNYSIAGGCCGYGTTIGAIFGGGAIAAAYQGLGYAATAAENIIGYGYDCIIIPGAFGQTNSGGTAGSPPAQQTSAVISQTLSGSPTTQIKPTPYPPQICGQGAGIGIGASTTIDAGGYAFATDNADEEAILSSTNLSICTRVAPFQLEFMSDDLEGIGGETAYTEYEQANTNRGFTLMHTQIACS